MGVGKHTQKQNSIGEPLSLPPGLIEAVRNKRVVLFLGAGASMEARGPKGEKPPSAAALRDDIATHFLGRPLPDHDLMSVADMAIETAGQSVVFERIKNSLDPLLPSAAHKLLPSFRWRAIATTNYDMLLEKAYGSAKSPLQNAVTVVKNIEPVEERLQSTERPVLVMKLHGCISHLHDSSIPLILSHEHYALHSRNRDNLFNRLEALTHESTFVFCGYRLGDAHIRNILHRLDADGIKRPTYYIVTPEMVEVESQYWSKQNITVIEGTFGRFMSALDAALPEMWRSLDAGTGLPPLPVRRHFRTNADPSQKLQSALDVDFQFVHASMPVDAQAARSFYEGYDTGWGAITQKLDAPRRIVNDLLLAAVVDAAVGAPKFFLLRGPAGSGKTIALKRAAWEASNSLDQVVLWLQDGGALRAEPIFELADLTGKRVFVFVDKAALQASKIETLLQSARQKSLPVTIIAGERDNEWNAYGIRLAERWQPEEFRLGQLSPREIEDLVTLLDEHQSLGLLANLNREERVQAFVEKADRQLLVALHEATRGKPFVDIVHDEYLGIISEQARRLYLDICTLNQFGVTVRAGTISRVSGISFNNYKDYLFTPLENVVLTGENRYTGDIEYRARHSRVAELVFGQVCPTDEAKVDQLLRMIEHLDVGYAPDRDAISRLGRGRSLKEILSGVQSGREIYRALLKASPETAFLYQQWAIFESLASGGSLEEADSLAHKAKEIDPKSLSISHTLAEISRKRAASSNSPLLKEQYRRQARQRLAEAGSATDMLVVSTKCKLLVDEVGELIETANLENDDDSARVLAEKVRDTEGEIRKAQQLYPDNADLFETEWRLGVLLQEQPRALRALERAWKAQPRGSGVAVRLSKAYLGKDDPAAAKAILTDALERNQDDKGAHLELAKLLFVTDQAISVGAGDHLARAYSPGDRNFDARHLHAQYLFSIGQAKDANKLFDEIETRAPAEFRAAFTASESAVSKLLPRFSGRVVRKDATYLFLRCSAYETDIYANENHSDSAAWEAIAQGHDVEFSVRFRRNGPVAHDVRLPS